MSEPRIEFRPLASFTEHDHAQLASLREEIDFALPPTTWMPTGETPWRVLVWQNGHLVSHVGIMERTILVAGAPVHVAGIRSVMTRPALRGKGYASMGMTRAAQYIADEMPRAEHGLLLCLDIRVPLYERLGWLIVREPTYYDQPEGRTRGPVNTMVRPFRGRPWPPGEIDLQGLPW